MNEEIEILKKLYPYFKMLDNINNYLTRVIRYNIENELDDNAEIFYNITSELLRLLPYKYNEKTSSIILIKSGIILLSNNIDYIKDKYKRILDFDGFYEVLKDVHRIRNKYIHEPHNISCAFSVGGISICSMGLYYKNELLSISSVSLAPIVYYLNRIFERIKEETMKSINQNKENKDNSYYKAFIEFDFSRDKWPYTILPEYLISNF